MMQKFMSPKISPALLSLALALFLTACGSSDEFYRLSASTPAAVGRTSGLSVTVGPVSLPGYIDRPEVVFQSGPNEFKLPSNARWIGSLQENISRVLAANLGQELHSNQVHSSLEPGFASQHRIAIEIRQFHGISGQDAILDLSWRIENAAGQTTSRHSAVFHEPIVGDGFKPLVVAESQLLAQCAHAIAVSLRGR